MIDLILGNWIFFLLIAICLGMHAFGHGDGHGHGRRAAVSEEAGRDAEPPAP